MAWTSAIAAVANGLLFGSQNLKSWCVAERFACRGDMPKDPASIMNVTQGHLCRRSCWGVARTALVCFLVAVAVFYLFGGFDPATVRPA